MYLQDLQIEEEFYFVTKLKGLAFLQNERCIYKGKNSIGYHVVTHNNPTIPRHGARSGKGFTIGGEYVVRPASILEQIQHTLENLE